MSTWVLPAAPALLGWIVAAATARGYLRGRRDPRIAATWSALVLLALALTVIVPDVSLALDRFVHLPNAARWLANALGLAGLYVVDRFHTELRGRSSASRRTRRLVGAYLVLSVLLMAWFMSLAHLTHDTDLSSVGTINLALIAYRFTYSAFIGWWATHQVVACAHYTRLSQDPSVRVGMAMLVVAGILIDLYLLITLSTIILLPGPALRLPLDVTIKALVLILAVCQITGFCLPAWGPRLGVPVLARHARYAVALWRVRPLWRALVAASPAVVLPTSLRWWSALSRTQQLEVLVHREVIEVLDAWRILTLQRELVSAGDPGGAILQAGGHDDQGSTASAPESADRSITSPPEMMRYPETAGMAGAVTEADLWHRARQDASRLVMMLEGGAAATRARTSDVSGPGYWPMTFDDQLRYLELVAQALRLLHPHPWEGWQWMRRSRAEGSVA